jgi:hypothetical protein
MIYRNMNGRASGHGRVYQAGGDQRFEGPHQHHHEYDYDQSGINVVFLGRGPGRLLVLIGMLIAGFNFTGWGSIIFGMWRNRQPSDDDLSSILGQMLPSGLPVGVVYFFGFGVGIVIMKLGASMAKAASRGSGVAGHLVATILIVTFTALGTIAVLDGAPFHLLVPHLSR